MAAALLRRALHLRRVLPSPTSPLLAASANRLFSSSTPTTIASQQNAATPIDLSSDESRRRLVNRLMYRSKQRGFLELDLVLGSWVEQHVHSMGEVNIRALLQVLDLENPDLWKWLSGQEEPPEDLNSNPKEKEQDYSNKDVEKMYQILSSSDDWASMQQALEMRSVHFGPSLVEAILKRCKTNCRAALQFFSWVRKQSYYMATTKTYNTAMKLAGSAKDFKHMRYLYKEMLRSGCSPTVDTWNVMVCQYGNAGLSKKALQTFYDMKQGGFLPDKTTYNHLIMYLTHIKGRNMVAAVNIFQEMCLAGHKIDNDVLFMYLSALCECRKIAEAKGSVACLCERGFSAQAAYSIFLRSLCRADRIEEALVLFHSIEKQGCSRDQYMYGSLIHAFLRRDQFEDAVAMITEMKNAGIPQSTHIYTSFIVYHFQKRDASKALTMLKEMEENGCEPTVVTYSALIRGHMAMGMVSEAWGVFHQMKHKGPAPDFETYSMFIKCLCKAGRSEDGLKLIHDMLDCRIIPSTVNFTTIVHGLNMEGKHELAQSVLRSKWVLRRQRTISD